jgi:hypothetical protein
MTADCPLARTVHLPLELTSRKGVCCQVVRYFVPSLDKQDLERKTNK